ncbi:MAG: MgtC/SapB family protein [Firmicutes bacterium]|nr:MgtC/SapB family protein [Bacillota bacterium]
MIGEHDVVVRLLAAFIFGGLIGLERELMFFLSARTRSAGLRTHILVCVGSALFMIVSENLHFQFLGDAGRVAAQVVSGIGFLGAGAILREGLVVRGLTTAASLWAVAAIGLAAGGGYFVAAAVVTLIVTFTLMVLGRLEEYIRERYDYRVITLLVADAPEQMGLIAEMLGQYNVAVRKVEKSDQCELGGQMVDITVRLPLEVRPGELLQRLAAIPGVRQVEYKG